ncbi:MAG: ferredoxin family protein [bacterium]|nr:ferredoxin family protein [bacterium]
MAKRISVVISQGQSQNPAKRNLEEDLVAALLMESGVDVVIVPHLYDLKADGTGMLALKNIPGDMVVVSWLFPRGAQWTLDRNGVHGKVGVTLLAAEEDDEDEENEEAAEAESKPRVIEEREIPNRTIYCLDFRGHNSPQPFVDEIKRIMAEANTQVMQLGDWLGAQPPAGKALDRFLEPTNDTALGPKTPAVDTPIEPLRIEEGNGSRRWYPVIDFSRCTNCMECIDFCLFGVYGVDGAETILVEQPDNCRKGCPACSRVCPENAIMFPQHKTPAIAGSADVAASLKIDLSQLFGAPEAEGDAVDVAIRERDEQLLMVGRTAVGDSVGLPKRQETAASEPNDELDDLIDQLDDLDI